MKKKPKIVSYHRVGTKKQLRPDIGDLLNEQKIEGINCVIPQKKHSWIDLFTPKY